MITDMTNETLVGGRGLVESPRWHDGRLYFSDWSAGEVLAVDEAGRCELVAAVDSLPLCTAFAPDGRLLIVSSATGQLLRREADGTVAPVAELGALGWNDIAVDGRGHAYVNGADFERMGGDETVGQVVLVTPDGAVRPVADDLAFPNGMVVTADDRTLIVADSYRHQLVAFTIAADGGLTDRRVWAELGEGTPDGICLDAEGAVWYADVPHRCCVRVAEGGAECGRVTLDRGGFACALGGADGRTLFTVAAEWLGWEEGVTPGSGQVIRTRVEVPAAR